MKKKFLDKFEELFRNYSALQQNYDNVVEDYKKRGVKLPELEEHKLIIQTREAIDKVRQLFSHFVFSLPNDQRKALYEEFEHAAITVAGENAFSLLNERKRNELFEQFKQKHLNNESGGASYEDLTETQKNELFERFKESYINDVGPVKFKEISPREMTDKYPTPEALEYSLFYITPEALILNGEARKLLEKALDHADDKTIESHLESIDSYESPYTHNVKVYPLRYRVEQLKERNNTEISDPEKRRQINEELDLIADIVVTSSSTYSSIHGESFDNAFRHDNDPNIDKYNANALSREENQHLNEYFEHYDSGEYGGIRPVNQKHAGDLNMINVFTSEKIKMVIPEDRKNSLRKIMNYMREQKMFVDDASAGDGALKIYGFKRIYDAHVSLTAAIETDDLDAIKNARVQYQAEVAKMRELFRMIKEEFNPDLNMMLGNVISYRENWVPNEFKNDVVCNALVNGIFNLNATLSQNNVSLEEMFENPNKAFFKILTSTAETAMPQAVLGGESNAEAIKIMASGRMMGKITAMGIGRNMEFLQVLTYGTDVFEKNSLSLMLIQSYAIYITEQMTLGASLTTKDYLKTKAPETIANMILVNPEDRDLNKLRAVPSVNIAMTEEIKSFDTMDYITSHVVEPQALIDRIKTTLSELDAIRKQILAELPKLKGSKRFDRMDPSVLRDAVYGAQMAAYKYILVHSEPIEGFMTEAEYKELESIAADPMTALSEYISDEARKELEKGTPPILSFVTDGHQKLEAARIEARAAEQDYAKKTADLKKRFDTLLKQLGKGKGDIQKITEERDQVENSLNALKKAELERLDKAYTDGKLTKPYYEQRRLDVENGNEKNTVPFKADEYPKFSKFKAQYKNELKEKELTLEDVRMFYDRMIENARFEDDKFRLIATGNNPKPELYEFGAFSQENIHTTAEPQKSHVDIPEVMEKLDGQKSPQVTSIEEKQVTKEFIT